NKAGGRSLDRGVRHGQIDLVEHVQEVSSKLQFEPLRKQEVLLYAGIPVVITGTAETANLWRARAEANSVGVVGRVKPLNTARCVCRGLATKHFVCTVAIGAQATGGSSGVIITVIVKG